MIEDVTVRIEGMSCHSCEINIETSLKAVPGIRSVFVDATKGEAQVAFDDSITTLAAIRSKIRDAGYEAPDLEDKKRSSPRFFSFLSRGRRAPGGQNARMMRAGSHEISRTPPSDTD